MAWRLPDAFCLRGGAPRSITENDCCPVGTVAPSLILRKLAAYPRRNDLAAALREIGRIERTLFMIDWALDPAMQRRAQIGLNKGESHHALKNALHCASDAREKSGIGPRRDSATAWQASTCSLSSTGTPPVVPELLPHTSPPRMGPHPAHRRIQMAKKTLTSP